MGLMPQLALVGDHDPAVVAHQAIPRALTLAARLLGARLDWDWVATPSLGADPAAVLAPYAGVWCVPASPYRHTEGVLGAIRFARESGRPFLGTCGGFQHAMIEYVRNAWGLADAAHGELEPGAADAVIVPLSCGLVEVSGEVNLVPGTRLAEYYGALRVTEGYHCRYGLSAGHAARLAQGPLRVAARDDAGEVRAVELEGHPFFFGTLFQPERAALDGRPHPLIAALVGAVVALGAAPPAPSRPC